MAATDMRLAVEAATPKAVPALGNGTEAVESSPKVGQVVEGDENRRPNQNKGPPDLQARRRTSESGAPASRRSPAFSNGKQHEALAQLCDVKSLGN